jgi:GNAT superfamily N-acetyltransferase
MNGAPVGFVLTSVWHGPANRTLNPPAGWVDAVAVAPEAQRQGIGSALLKWAEASLRAQGCASARLGASLRWFAPGVPVELGDAFFRARGFQPREDAAKEWDMGRDLHDYISPASLRPLDVNCRPATYSDIEPLRDFFAREFPDRWRYEFEQHLRDGGDIADYMLLESSRRIDACCQMTLEESVRRAERFYPAPLPHPWGQVGSVGVSAGYGSVLLDAALKHLQARGVRGCIIDWTDLTNYYERFGFIKHRAYHMLSKSLANVSAPAR